MSKVLHVVLVAAAFSVCACSRDAAANSDAAGDDVQLSAVDTVGQPLSSVPTPRRRLAAGTSIAATIQQIVSSRTTGRGQLVTAIVTRNVSDDSGHVLIPGGATIKLAIAAVRSARSATPDDEGVLSLSVRSLTVGIATYRPAATIAAVPHVLQPGLTAAERDVVVTAGTPITITLAKPLKILAN